MDLYLPPEAKQQSDLFRARYCYNQQVWCALFCALSPAARAPDRVMHLMCAPLFVGQVDDVLISHMTTMRSLYEIYSTANDKNAAINSSRLMSVRFGHSVCCAHVHVHVHVTCTLWHTPFWHQLAGGRVGKADSGFEVGFERESKR